MGGISGGRRRLAVGLAAVGAVMAWAAIPAPAAAEDEYVPQTSPGVEHVEHDNEAFGDDPSYEDKPYDPEAQLLIYGGKRDVPAPRPLIELGREIYTAGPFQPSSTFLGEKNPVIPHLYVYGDLQTVVGYADNGAASIGQVAARLNLDVDFQITSTERIHAFLRPLDQNNKFTRCEFAGNTDDDGCEEEINGNLETLFFEGDVGPIMQGLTGEYNQIDLPFAVGFTPLLLQNGIWLEDAAIGGAITLPSRHSSALDISNMDVTAFMFLDKVDSLAFRDRFGAVAQHNVDVYGITAFIERGGGYWELGYGYSDGDGFLDQFSYHNATIAYSRRYYNLVSNSVRVIGNFGQSPDAGVSKTADGVVFLVENSLIVNEPATLVPYLNVFAGFNRPQGLGQQARGILKNTGINFETDAITQFPKLDDSANDTWGGALGISYLFNLDQQIVAEVATNQIMGDPGEIGRPAFDDEYAIGLRYQIPVSSTWIVRADAMYGWREGVDDLAGVRMELKRKF